MKILNTYQGKMFYIQMLIQKAVNIVIRDNQDDLTKTFDKGIHLSVNNRHSLVALLWIRLIGCLLPRAPSGESIGLGVWGLSHVAQAVGTLVQEIGCLFPSAWPASLLPGFNFKQVIATTSIP